MNLANLEAAVDSIPTNTLAGLKAALKNGTAQEKFPVGHEIPDTYAGNSNPLVVAQYLNPNNNSKYGGAEGVILIRKYVEPASYVFSSVGPAAIDYATSDVLTFLKTNYLQNCSDDLKSLVSPLAVPYYVYDGTNIYDDSKLTYVRSEWNLCSGTEILNPRAYSGEGIAFDIWKQRMGYSSPNDAPTQGRVVLGIDGEAKYWWERSFAASAPYNVCYVSTSGDTYNWHQTNVELGVLPFCFISKD